MENLHAMLALHDPDIPTFFGAHYNLEVPGGTVSGGAGYLLSRKAVELVVTEAFTNKSLCREQDDGREDAEMAWCLSRLGVHPSVSRDIKRDEETFIPLHIWSMMTLTEGSWMSTYMMKKPLTGFDCCSERAISFHYISHPRYILYINYF
ncbi:glycoprotein-N-acetylgalactosamine 3-beta-galactosyltransferase 1 [Eurytemora carolleeae]|uniref:glycoprotein-N-acetylgalactosamine 3-beta-galactosyltransferase 1 n=1 Tax=Eurytemora carolleeae TaxID=1294199 RepID=UPI000C76AA67|nr:glycoprotein-N-acetylgalactosamine 3-beta-galactosyltransferase 1 [Eurytemora carolleeae]|eukprot:XP_023346734.1 glycoprotein-N-acetylgalactosamine 3-beta-galactosyltransferase 1-like [Eurytemora affinis]